MKTTANSKAPAKILTPEQEAERVRQARISVPAERAAEESRRNRAAGRRIRAWRKTV